jgi:hypothetical protein
MKIKCSESTNGYELRQNSKQRCTEGTKYLFSIANAKKKQIRG